ncbi:MAG TPA: hypothetical protein VJK71_02075 [Gemmatimonadales bacterium]|nr:hypothetical protein [Gemmatimonadales bacterium]
MPPQEPLGPFSQSCNMPLTAPAEFGTDRQGYRVNEGVGRPGTSKVD